MEIDDIIKHIFGPDFHKPNHQTMFQNEPKSGLLENVHHWVDQLLQDMGVSSDKDPWVADLREGRIGPAVVHFDTATHVGLFVVGSDRLSVNSQSNFSTIRANVCLYGGKWQYEIQLGSKGVMQLGWATSSCKFSQEIGVGDTVSSFAYDGNRVRKWNVATYKYGESWLSGDIIGCIADFDMGVLEFYRNGRSMREAFTNVPIGPGRAYFPAVSLAYTENLVANFGSTPFKYPVPGFEPIQQAPHQDLAKAEKLCHWLYRLLMLFDRKYEMIGLESSPQVEDVMSNQALLMGLAREFLRPMASLLLSPYIVEACLMVMLKELCRVPEVLGRSKTNVLSVREKRRLTLLLDMMWAFLEEFEMRQVLESILSYLLSDFRHVSFVLEYPHQRQSLLMLTFVLQHPHTRRYLLENILFDKIRFCNFVHVKPLDEGGLQEIVKEPWWETTPPDLDIDKNKAGYFAACHLVKEATAVIEALQIELLKTLLDNTDGSSAQPSSRKIFLRKFRNFLHENLISSRSLPFLQTPLPITLCCFHRLLVTFRQLWDREVVLYPVVIPARCFYDSSIHYYGVDRLGGVLSHLNKTLVEDLVKVLGPDHEVVTSFMQTLADGRSSDVASLRSTDSIDFFAGPSANLEARFDGRAVMIPMLAHMLSEHPTLGTMFVERFSSASSYQHAAPKTTSSVGNLDAASSLIELLDGLVLFYHMAAHKQISKVSTLRDSMADYTSAVASNKSRLSSLSPEDSSLVAAELQRATQVFEDKLMEQSRHMAWVRAAVFSPEKQSHLAWLFRVVLQTVKLSSQEGQLFSFVPDFYLEALVELCTALRTYLHPTCPIDNIEGYEDLLIEMAEFLCDHFSDTRIVHANSKDTMIQALASFVCCDVTLDALEKVPYASRMNMVHSLLRPYENRAWAQSNWVLVRMWQGCGFAFRYKKSPHLSRKLGPKVLHTDASLISHAMKPCPSPLFQGHIREVMLSNEALSTSFLNSLLNQLNWAFSEFIGMLQEIQNVSNRPERVFIESRQLRICATCFDLALALLRVLEMISSIAGEIFKDPLRVSSELLLSRLCQLMCQVLNRVSSQAGCFQHVVQLEIPDLETVDHFPILTAVVGILLALLKEELDQFSDENLEVPKIAKALLTEPSFQISSLRFLMGDIQKVLKKQRKMPFSLINYAEDVSMEEQDRVRNMIRMLDVYSKLLSDVKVIADEDVCTICYAYPINATFKPCNHQSCRSCITHYLMNCKNCFFCKAAIEFVMNSDGTVLLDLTKTDIK
uniref:E3 ubiquitin-protein ligase RNF123 n=1 Tax=Timema douglasi TaxID=61478 RepID=A0A7R8Z7C7_TIMDO|nr:unnamed protein product [Timema douglasi]